MVTLHNQGDQVLGLKTAIRFLQRLVVWKKQRHKLLLPSYKMILLCYELTSLFCSFYLMHAYILLLMHENTKSKKTYFLTKIKAFFPTAHIQWLFYNELALNKQQQINLDENNQGYDGSVWGFPMLSISDLHNHTSFDLYLFLIHPCLI